MAFLFRISLSFAAFQSFDTSFVNEGRTTCLVLALAHLLEIESHLVFLAPFDEFAFEIHLFISHLVYIDEFFQYLLLHKPHTGVVSSVKIDGSDESFKCVSSHIAVMAIVVSRRKDELVDAHFLCKTVECVSLYEFASCIGEESLSFSIKVPIDNIAYHGVEDGITQKFQSLVVYRFSFSVSPCHTLVHESHFVIFYLSWIESQYLVKRRKKLLLLSERELYFVNNDIIQHIS